MDEEIGQTRHDLRGVSASPHVRKCQERDQVTQLAPEAPHLLVSRGQGSVFLSEQVSER
jgi:hypothetical protein